MLYGAVCLLLCLPHAKPWLSAFSHAKPAPCFPHAKPGRAMFEKEVFFPSRFVCLSEFRVPFVFCFACGCVVLFGSVSFVGAPTFETMPHIRNLYPFFGCGQLFSVSACPRAGSAFGSFRLSERISCTFNYPFRMCRQVCHPDFFCAFL